MNKNKYVSDNERNARAVAGFLLTIIGVVIALVCGFLAVPIVIAIPLGGVTVAQGLGVLGGIVLGGVLALVGQAVMK